MTFSRRIAPVFFLPLFASLGVAVFISALGCESSAPVEAESRPVPTPPTPEEQFENIVKTLRLKVQDPAIRGGSAEADFGSEPGTPVTDWSTTISHKLLSVEEGKPRRAVVTISTKSTITVILPQANTDDPTNEKSGTLSGSNPPRVEGMPDIESLRVPISGTQLLGRSSIKTLPDEQQTRLGFEHRDGKWVLVTPIDAEEEPFNAAAVRYALRRQ